MLQKHIFLIAGLLIVNVAFPAAARNVLTSDDLYSISEEGDEQEVEDTGKDISPQSNTVAYFGDDSGYTNYEYVLSEEDLVLINQNLGVSINIATGTTPQSSSISAKGTVSHVITDSERQTFGITDAALKNAVGKYFGRNPDDAYVRSPTPWNDLYKTYGWPQVTAVLTVTDAKITGVSSQPSIVAQKSLINNSPFKGTFKTDIQETVTNTVESSWSNNFGISFEQTFKYEVGFLGTGGGGETKFGFSAQFGTGGSKSTSVGVGSSSSVEVSLKPGQGVEAVLTATRSVLKARITYAVTLNGLTAINYGRTYNGHHFWALSIGGVMGSAGLSNSRQVTEDIELGYYSSGKVKLQKLSTKKKHM